jgi:hypothetical protein
MPSSQKLTWYCLRRDRDKGWAMDSGKSERDQICGEAIIKLVTREYPGFCFVR